MLYVCTFEVLGHVNISGHWHPYWMMMMDDYDGQMTFGEPWGPKASWHLSYRWGKTLEKPHPGNLSRLGIEPGPAAWQAHMLPPSPNCWTAGQTTLSSVLGKCCSVTPSVLVCFLSSQVFPYYVTLLSKCRIHSIKIIQFWQLIWKF